eukprot:32078-Chlamydomonas_euryale.AAC.1
MASASCCTARRGAAYRRAQQTRPGTSPWPSSSGFQCSYVAAGRVTAASACCRCWSTRRHG